MRLEFLTRRGCPLCTEALERVHRAGLAVAVVDIDLDPDLLAAYDHRVPVIRDAATGSVLAEGAIAESDLAALAQQ